LLSSQSRSCVKNARQVCAACEGCKECDEGDFGDEYRQNTANCESSIAVSEYSTSVKNNQIKSNKMSKMSKNKTHRRYSLSKLSIQQALHRSCIAVAAAVPAIRARDASRHSNSCGMRWRDKLCSQFCTAPTKEIKRRKTKRGRLGTWHDDARSRAARRQTFACTRCAQQQVCTPFFLLCRIEQHHAVFA
jgi:hypothetical protein